MDWWGHDVSETKGGFRADGPLALVVLLSSSLIGKASKALLREQVKVQFLEAELDTFKVQ